MADKNRNKGLWWENGYWRWRVQVGGRVENGSVKGTASNRNAEKAAKNERDRAKSELKSGIRKLSDPSRLTVDDLVTKFREVHFSKARMVAKEIRESTINRYETDLKNHIIPFFQGRRLSYLNNKSNLRSFQSHLLNKRKCVYCPPSKEYKDGRLKELDDNLSLSSIDKACDLIRTMLVFALSEKMVLETNYCLPTLDDDDDSDGIDGYAWFDNPNHEEAFLETAKSWEYHVNGSGITRRKESPYYSLYVVALNTGLRKGELKGLEEADINFDKGIIHVKRQWLTSLNKPGPTKSGKPRFVTFDTEGPVAEELRRAMAISRERRSRFDVSDPEHTKAVFTSSEGKRISGDSFSGEHFKAILKQAGLSDEYVFHSLRHTFACKYYAEVGNIKDVQNILGHQDEKTTRKYLHLTEHNLPPAPKLIVRRRAGHLKVVGAE